MPFADRLIHDLAIVTPTENVMGDVDDYGQPIAGVPEVVLVSGLIQPRGGRNAREVPLISQAGAELSDHVVFLERRDLTTASYIRREPNDGDRFEIVGIRDYNYGRSAPHLEVDCKRIRSEALVTS